MLLNLEQSDIHSKWLRRGSLIKGYRYVSVSTYVKRDTSG